MKVKENVLKVCLILPSVVKAGKPFSDYELICEIQVKNGLDLGENNRNINGCKIFAASIAQTLVDKQVKFQYLSYKLGLGKSLTGLWLKKFKKPWAWTCPNFFSTLVSPRRWPSWIFNRSKKQQHLVSSLQWSFITIFNSILHVHLVSEKIIKNFSQSRGFDGPWQPCWITDRNESNNTWLDHANEHSRHIWSHLLQWFSRRRLKCLRMDDKWWQ